MAGFKTVKRKVTVEREVRTITIANNNEAAAILHGYCNVGGADYRARYGVANHRSGEEGDRQVNVLVFAAALFMLKSMIKLGVTTSDLTEFGVDPLVPCAIEPTWTGSDGKTQTLRSMPTRYLQSVRRFAESMTERDERGKFRGQGLLDAIDTELGQRDEVEE